MSALPLPSLSTPPPVSVTAPAPPLRYAVEAWGDVQPELARLWDAHWREVALDQDTIALAPDLASYAAFAASGALHVVTVRASGRLVGYHVSLVRPHLHYRHSLSAFTDMYYLAPAHRRGLAGVALFRHVEQTLKSRGVQRVFTATKLHLDMSPIFRRLGFRETERLYSKVI